MSDFTERSLEDLAEELTAMSAHMSAGMCRYLALVAECDRRGTHAADWGSTAAWLAWRCGVDPRPGRAQVSYHNDEDGSLVLHARLARVHGALFRKALEVQREKLWDERTATADIGSAEPWLRPRRPTNVEAFVALTDAALAHEEQG